MNAILNLPIAPAYIKRRRARSHTRRIHLSPPSHLSEPAQLYKQMTLHPILRQLPLRLPRKKSLRIRDHALKRLVRAQTPLDPRRQFLPDIPHPIPPIEQVNGSVVLAVPDGAADALVDGAHAHVLDVVAGGGGCWFGLRRLAVLDVLELGPPFGGVGVGEGEADHDDGAAEAVGEVDSFGEFAADDGEEEAAFARVDGGGVGAEEDVGLFGFGVREDGFVGEEGGGPAGQDQGEVVVAGEEDDDAVGDC